MVMSKRCAGGVTVHPFAVVTTCIPRPSSAAITRTPSSSTPSSSREAVRAQRDGGAPRQQLHRFMDVQRPCGTACETCQVAHGALDCTPLLRGVHTALEALGRIGDMADAPRPAQYRGRREVGSLEENVAGIGTDGGARTAHDPTQADRPGLVGDHQHVGVDLDVLAIKQRQRLVLPAPDAR